LRKSALADSKYVVGIDLGTTNSVVAWTESSAEKGEHPAIRVFEIPQLIAPGTVDKSATLPSFVLLPGPHDVPEGGLALPWDPDSSRAVGAFARDRGAEIPHRLISSAKSWLANHRVDRNEKTLPWGAEEPPQGKLSPVEASAAVLSHIRSAWNHEMAAQGEEALLENQEIHLTVPASFDAVARELTVRAAQMAGMERVTLLEEPQAAFYSWIWQSRDNWREQVDVGDLVLVCDVGGGTSDFSLIQVSQEEGDLALERVAVGEHLLVGGDNMDLTLAHVVAAKLSSQGKKLDAWQMRGLWQSCRNAKEKLLSGEDVESAPITVLGRGSGLIAGTIKTELTREEIQKTLSDGFLPFCEKGARPVQSNRMGMRELGLIYESDPSVTCHLASFLAKFGNGVPTAILFNGGVMKAPAFRDRVKAVLDSWDDGGVRELSGAQYDLSVATGAAYYGLARRGAAVRIRGGLNRAYYIGVEASMPAVPGMSAPVRALCVAPFGMEEGTGSSLSEARFGLVVGEDVRFELLASTQRKDDKAGNVVDDWEKEIEPVDTLMTMLDGEAGEVMPVTLEVQATEVGTLELWCVSEKSDKKWKLEFSVRERDDLGAS